MDDALGFEISLIEQNLGTYHIEGVTTTKPMCHLDDSIHSLCVGVGEPMIQMEVGEYLSSSVSSLCRIRRDGRLRMFTVSHMKYFLPGRHNMGHLVNDPPP